MKPYVLYFVIFLFSLSSYAQIDNEKKSFSIPAIESPKDSSDIVPLRPSKPISANNKAFGINRKTSTNLELPKKDFSMFPDEEFGNPGELHTKKLDKIEKQLLPEGYGSNGGLKEDAYWGDYYTKSEYIDISYRDYGRIDGDLLNILVDDDVIKSNVYLSGGFKGFRLQLKEGLNKIEFYAINEGSLLPNTAQYKIVDQWSSVITGKIWSLSKGVKVTIIIVKE
ncbi:hypothetical protein GCM10023311_25930 [Flaviramulus aquimarinus]|uniref:Secreted protein n=2 Tax=Flaviramulus aquimarinus TaxID=1170456 RepID=A0ABP9FCR0_9FLAO